MKRGARATRATWIPLAALLLATCTLRVGGPGPVAFTAAAFLPPPHEEAHALARRIQESGAGAVIVLADQRPEWFRMVLGEGEDRVLPGEGNGWMAGISAPGLSRHEGPSGLPPLRRAPALVAPLLVEGRFRIGRRPVHLLGARIPAGGAAPLRTAVATLLERIAEEAEVDALLLVAVALEDPDDGPELDALVGEYLLGVDRCGEPLVPPSGFRIYRAPAALSECSFARALEGGGILLGLSTNG